MKRLNELQIRCQAFRGDWCEVEPIYFCFFSRRISQQRANSKTSNLPPNPHMRTRHRSTAELRVVVIETSRTESLTEEPSPESNDLAMPRLRTRETVISPCVGLAPSLNVCTSTRKDELPYCCCTQQYCCNSARVLGTHWVHNLGHLESTNLPASVAARSVSNLSLIHI